MCDILRRELRVILRCCRIEQLAIRCGIRVMIRHFSLCKLF